MTPSPASSKLYNAIWFQLGWFAAIGWQDQAWTMLVSLTVFHLIKHRQQGIELKLVLAVSVYGITIDSILLYLGVYDFHASNHYIPLWLVLLWPIFAGTLRFSLRPIFGYPALYLPIGGLFGCVSYLAAMRLGAVSFPLGLPVTAAILIPIWVGHFYLFKRLIFSLENKDKVQRPASSI